MTSIVDAPEYLFTSESVTEGHPDKLCDQVSDAILDSIIREDPTARVACETATTTGLVIVLGEITTKTYVDFQQVVRDTVRDIGYTRADYGFDYETCGTLISIKEQSPDIAQGVNASLETRGEKVDAGERSLRQPVEQHRRVVVVQADIGERLLGKRHGGGDVLVHVARHDGGGEVAEPDVEVRLEHNVNAIDRVAALAALEGR